MYAIEKLEARVLLSSVTFLPPQQYITPPGPRATAIADFNGDGKPDIAAAIVSSDSVSILLNNGDGTFSHAPAVVDVAPRAVAAADFNHDGKVDLAVLGPDTSGGATIDIFLGNGDGTFAKKPAHYHLGGNGPAIIAADLNGDGWDDIVALTFQRVAVLINRQDGTFSKPVYYNIGGANPSDLVVGDFNNDGVPDLAISRGRRGDVTILLGNKNAPGTFSAPSFFPTGGNPESLAVGDFNHDGKLDLAVSNFQFKGNPLAVLLGTGDGSFRPAAYYAGANFSDAVVAADFGNTGNVDLITGSYDGPLKFYQGNSDGTFATPTDISGGQFTQRIAVADLNGDGLLDLVISPFGYVRVLLNSTGSVTPPPSNNGLDKIIGAGGTRIYTFYTTEGTRTTISLSGPGSATLHFTSSSTITVPIGEQRPTVTALSLSTITATGTTRATSLAITTNAGSHTITFDSITTDGAFRAISAPRANLTGALTLPGGASQISLLSANNGTVTLGGGPRPSLAIQQTNNEIINSAVPINQFTVRLDAGVTLTAPSIASMHVSGSLINSSFTLTARGTDLARLMVIRSIGGTSITTAGSIGSIDARTMFNSNIDAAVSLLPPDNLPTSAGQFTAPALLQRLSLQIDQNQPSFVNSTIVAFAEGTLNLGRIQTANGDVPFGLGAHSIKSVSGTDLTSHRSFHLARITSSAAAAAALAAKRINPQDFQIRVV